MARAIGPTKTRDPRDKFLQVVVPLEPVKCPEESDFVYVHRNTFSGPLEPRYHAFPVLVPVRQGS
jgi:hypothetical protein